MKQLPGPRGLRASVDLARRLNADPYTALRQMRDSYGPVIEFGWGRFRYVYLLSPEANEYVLVTGADNFTWREAFQPLAAVNGDTALVLSDGDDHARRRKLVQPAFHRRRIAAYFDTMVEETNAVIDRWRPGQTIDAYADFRLAIRRIVLRCLFGSALRGRDAELAEHLEVALAYVNRPPGRRLDWDLPGLPYRTARQARHAVDEIVTVEMERRRAEGQRSDDVLDWLLTEQDEAGSLTDEEIRDQVVSLVAAGYDTTASAMGWASAHLARDPSHRERIRTEVAATAAGAPLDVTDLAALPYTMTFVTEVLRHHPPAIWSGRRASAKFELHGHKIEAGSMILFSPHVTQHLDDEFAAPDRFLPNRWIDDDPDRDDPHPYAYVPFGGGSRRCLGFAFATQELMTMVAIQAVRAETRLVAAEPLRPVGTMSSASAGGVLVEVDSVEPAPCT